MNEQSKAKLIKSLQDMIQRVMANSGMSESDVRELVVGLFATDIEAVDKTNVDRVLTPKAGWAAFQHYLAEWVGSAPETLNTLEELSNALQGNPEIIAEIVESLGKKETPKGAQDKVDALNAALAPKIEAASKEQGKVRNMNIAPDNKFISNVANDVIALPVGVYYGYASAALLGLNNELDTVSLNETVMLTVTVSEHPVYPDGKLVERQGVVGGKVFRCRVDPSELSTGENVHAKWTRMPSEHDIRDLQDDMDEMYWSIANLFCEAARQPDTITLGWPTTVSYLHRVPAGTHNDHRKLQLRINKVGTWKTQAVVDGVTTTVASGTWLPTGGASESYKWKVASLLSSNGTFTVVGATDQLAVPTENIVLEIDAGALDHGDELGLHDAKAVVCVTVEDAKGIQLRKWFTLSLTTDNSQYPSQTYPSFPGSNANGYTTGANAVGGTLKVVSRGNELRLVTEGAQFSPAMDQKIADITGHKPSDFGIVISAISATDLTLSGGSFDTELSLDAATWTLGTSVGFRPNQSAIKVGITVSNRYNHMGDSDSIPVTITAIA